MENKGLTILEINELLGTEYSDKSDFLINVNWGYISGYSVLSEDFIKEFQDKVDWERISHCQILSEDFIREFQDKVDWEHISRFQKLSEDFILEFGDRVDWYYIGKEQRLSEPFIREHNHKMCWLTICRSQKISEDFIDEFSEHIVSWDEIAIFHKLSESFIRKYQNKLYWEYISMQQKLSPEFQEEFKDKLNFGQIKDNWVYKDVEFKKQAVMDTGLYECHEDYFIAYKGIRRDRYSCFNFQYQYLKGETYESWCDCSEDENSFGLSVWTEEMATDYCSDLVVRVKVRYEDVGRVIHDGGKIRCFKIEILD